MKDNDKIAELEAMIIHLTKRIEKLEGKTRMAPPSSYLRELSEVAAKILKFWA